MGRRCWKRDATTLNRSELSALQRSGFRAAAVRRFEVSVEFCCAVRVWGFRCFGVRGFRGLGDEGFGGLGV